MSGRLVHIPSRVSTLGGTVSGPWLLVGVGAELVGRVVLLSTTIAEPV